MEIKDLLILKIALMHYRSVFISSQCRLSRRWSDCTSVYLRCLGEESRVLRHREDGEIFEGIEKEIRDVVIPEFSFREACAADKVRGEDNDNNNPRKFS